MTIKGVSIGDKFIHGKNIKCEVVDFIGLYSISKGVLVGHQCIAKGIDTMSTNTFEVPFATVVRGRIK